LACAVAGVHKAVDIISLRKGTAVVGFFANEAAGYVVGIGDVGGAVYFGRVGAVQHVIRHRYALVWVDKEIAVGVVGVSTACFVGKALYV